MDRREVSELYLSKKRIIAVIDFEFDPSRVRTPTLVIFNSIRKLIRTSFYLN